MPFTIPYFFPNIKESGTENDHYKKTKAKVKEQKKKERKGKEKERKGKPWEESVCNLFKICLTFLKVTF